MYMYTLVYSFLQMDRISLALIGQAVSEEMFEKYCNIYVYYSPKK